MTENTSVEAAQDMEQLSFFDPRERRARYRAKHRERRIAQMKAWRAKNRAHMAAYREAHREERKVYNREWARANPEKNTARCTRWRERNPEYMRAVYRVKAQVRRAVGPVGLDAREYADVLMADPCSYCGRPSEAVDHIIPISRGGTNAWDNFTSACTSCNSRKNARPLLHALLRGVR